MPRIQHKRGTSANLASVNPTPLAGELVWDSTENAVKIGDGATAWSSLAYVTATPRTHTHSADAITSGTVAYARLPVGSTASTVCAGDDARLSDARSPTAHKTSHATGGSDALTPADIGAAPAANPTFTGTVTVPGLTSTGVILADDAATANSVVYSFDGDPNTGIGRGGADIVTIVTAGSERVRVDSSGNVGINGATNLTNLLTIRTTADGSIASPVYDGISWVYRTNGSPGTLGAIEFVSRFANYAGGGLRFQLRNSVGTLDDSLFIDNQSNSATFGANFGIRVAIPATSGSAGSYLPSLTFSGDSNTGLGQVGGADSVSLITAGSERVRVDANGRVLIGATSGTFPFTLVANSSAQSIQIRGRSADGIADLQMTSNDGETRYFYLTSRSTHAEMRAPSGGYLSMADFNGVSAIYISSGRNVGIGTTSPSALLDINSNTMRLRTARTPASASAAGNAGDICWDASYLYICTATDTWRRIAHSTW